MLIDNEVIGTAEFGLLNVVKVGDIGKSDVPATFISNVSKPPTWLLTSSELKRNCPPSVRVMVTSAPKKLLVLSLRIFWLLPPTLSTVC